MRLALVAFCLFALVLRAGAKPGEFLPATAPVRAAIERAVLDQLAAFRREDFTAAREFAVAALKAKFPPAEFETMVRRGYPQVAANHGGRLGEFLDDGQRAIGRVIVVSREGRETVFRYVLMREGEAWRIAGLAESVEPLAPT